MRNSQERRREFAGSRQYWEQRYARGGTSGPGSSGALAQFKAQFLNDFVAQHAIGSVIEIGCGDGRQLALARYPSYTGIDVSPTAIEFCKKRYAGQSEYRFFLAADRAAYNREYDLALSLDVIFHLVEDEVYELYMRDLFTLAKRFVIVYASNTEGRSAAAHVRHRRFTDWVAREAPQWLLIDYVPNPYPADPERPGETSFSDFYVFAPKGSGSTRDAGENSREISGN